MGHQRAESVSGLNRQIGTHIRPQAAATHAAAFLILAVLAWVIYHPVVGYDFLKFDDRLYILDNEAIANGLSAKMLVGAFTRAYHGNWQPMAIIVHAADVTLFGFRPGFHHLSSVVWHVVNCILLYSLTLRLVGSAWGALAAAVLFLVHPQHVEPVVWISSRQHLVGATFFLLCLLAYTRYVRTRDRWDYALVAIAFVAAILAKSITVSTPFVLLLLDIWPFKRFKEDRGVRQMLLEKLPLFGVCAAYALTLYTRETDQRMIHSLQEVPLAARLDNIVFAYGMYVKNIFSTSALSVHYPHTMGHTPASVLALIVALLTLVTAVAVFTIRKWPMIFVSWFWFVGMLFPVSGIVSYHYHCMADRYTYVPHIGLIVGFVALADRLIVNRTRALAAAALAIVLGVHFTIASVDRVPRFKNDMRLFAESVELYPRNPFGLNCLGFEFAAQDYLEEATTMYERSLEVGEWESLRIDAHQVAAVTYDHMGAPALAYAHYAEAQRVKPDDKLLALRVGESRAAAEKQRRQILILEQAAPAERDAKVENALALARLYGLQRRSDDAVRMYEFVAKLTTPSLDLDQGIVEALALADRPRDALVVARQACLRDPDNPEANYLLIRALLRAREFSEAEDVITQASARFPKHRGILKLRRLLCD